MLALLGLRCIRRMLLTYINRLSKPIKINDQVIEPEKDVLSLKPRDDTMFIVPNRVWTSCRRHDVATPDPKNTTEIGGIMICGGLLCH